MTRPDAHVVGEGERNDQRSDYRREGRKDQVAGCRGDSQAEEPCA
jgi:hypothetical protein